MNKILKTVLILFLNNLVSCENDFKSVPVTVKAYENDTVLLPCYVNGIDSPVEVRWYRNTTLLSDTGDAQVLPPRVTFHANYSLQVDSIAAQDTADYTCVVVRADPLPPIRQTHTIEVQYAPTVKTVPEDGFLEVRKGEYVDIGCETTGTPSPIVDWRKNGEPMPLLEHRSRIRFRAEHRLLAGVYECIVNNGVGDPVSASIRVVIHDAPVVTAERTFVHTALDLRAALAATVAFAVPPARTAWYRDGRPVNTDDRVLIIAQDNVYQLIFRKVRKSDLGNYTFRAENQLGMADVSFKLTGVPNVASFKVDAALNKATSTSFTLIWEVDSYSTIIEYNLWLRPYYGRLVTPEPDAFTTEQPANLWSKIIVPGDSSDGPIHSALYTVRGLTPSTVYEAIVTSRNRFGWSKPSAVLHFATEPGAGRTKPSTIDYMDITPTLEQIEFEPHNMSQAQVSERYDELANTGARESVTFAAIFVLTLPHIHDTHTHTRHTHTTQTHTGLEPHTQRARPEPHHAQCLRGRSCIIVRLRKRVACPRQSPSDPHRRPDPSGHVRVTSVRPWYTSAHTRTVPCID